MTNEPLRGQRKGAQEEGDPTEWHGHRIVTEQDLGAVFDDDESTEAAEERARRKRTLHTVVLGLLIAVLIGAAVVAQGITAGWIALPRAEPRPAVESGCPAGPYTYQPPESVTVNVYNTTATPGLAGQVAEALKTRGFAIGVVGNSTVNREGMTAIILSGPEGEPGAFTIQQQIPDTQYIQDDREDASVDVVLGSGYSDLIPLETAQAAAPGPITCPWKSEGADAG
ncbi:LytR family transcriptional regulator [Arthrobacter sp. BL-252-APC-1A]|uniref:LytR C-terminal domain-containing protein n=1 Tax=Arthrobacter sp. BL-252-APC-1A TaxID=2606622 RepID=UPI0012B25CA3|nr:LytR C-terminal domain-containing protein [Arthrobacter sp. BL-252-APC-1A]MSS00260.1 LytR family transcriptional regulator [Arthrobacter sp. BL-252-APC-1A]